MIIVGTGCAGLTAAIYAARANLAPLVLEGHEPGGQLSTTTLVENFPGFPDGIDGPDLIINMKKQAERFGARFAYSSVNDFEPADGHVRLKVDDEWMETRTLIVASGASARWLGLPREKELCGPWPHLLRDVRRRLLPKCAGLRRRRGRFGLRGSDLSHALSPRRCISSTVATLCAPRKSWPIARSAIPRWSSIWNTVPIEYLTDEAKEVRAVKLRDTVTGAERELEVKCVFVAIGHNPNTAAFKGKLDMDENGYLLQREGTRTNVPGVFAAGDVADHVYRQAITAAGQGCAAALDAEKYLSHLGHAS